MGTECTLTGRKNSKLCIKRVVLYETLVILFKIMRSSFFVSQNFYQSSWYEKTRYCATIVMIIFLNSTQQFSH